MNSDNKPIIHLCDAYEVSNLQMFGCPCKKIAYACNIKGKVGYCNRHFNSKYADTEDFIMKRLIKFGYP